MAPDESGATAKPLWHKLNSYTSHPPLQIIREQLACISPTHTLVSDSGRRDANVEAIERAQAAALTAAEAARPFTAPGQPTTMPCLRVFSRSCKY